MNFRFLAVNKKIIALTFFLTILLFSFSKNDTTAFNPYFRDSILKTKTDTAKWNTLIQRVDIHKKGKNILIQKQRQGSTSSIFIFFALTIFIVLLIFRLVFEDFSFSMLEGLTSIKKFYIFYKSKKYDSLFAVLSIFLLKSIIIALVVYVALQNFTQHNLREFKVSYFLNILFTLGFFYIIKNLIEFIFNWVIGTEETYRAFFLLSLFAEYFISVILILFLLLVIYNINISFNILPVFLIFCFTAYIVFNMIRSYQLMSNMRIPYKLHFFLYICAFKILPLLVLAKYIINNVIA